MQTKRPSAAGAASIDTHHEEVKDTRDAILLGIDGTADVFDDDYKASMDNSFVSRIVRESSAQWKQYIRGPGFDGVDMFALISKGYEFIHLHKFKYPDAKVLLTGYSRGGAGVVGVAQRLKREGIKVDGMILFDPVNRSQTSSTDDVPNNVLNMVQARRATRSYSRVSFNNCAVTWHAPTKCDIAYFWATHGGVGGVPWKPEPAAWYTPWKDDETVKDFVDEGIGEHILTNVTYTTLYVAWEQPRDYRGTLGELVYERLKVGGRTQITFEQDALGAEAVWKWTFPWLRKFGFYKRK
jgi:hypothetical protein